MIYEPKMPGLNELQATAIYRAIRICFNDHSSRHDRWNEFFDVVNHMFDCTPLILGGTLMKSNCLSITPLDILDFIETDDSPECIRARKLL